MVINTILKFILWFSISLVSIIILEGVVNNDFTIAFILASVIGFVAVKDD